MQVIRKEKRVYESRWSVRRKYRSLKEDLIPYAVVGCLLTLLFPPLGFIPLFLYMLRLQEFHSLYLSGSKKEYYRRLLEPKMASKIFLEVGYEIDPETELTRHLRMVNLLDSKDKAAINYMKKMEQASRNEELYRQVGLSKSQLTTHFWVIGTTGAGKTSLIMQLARTMARIGGGMMFVDGKADTKMFFKLYNLAKQEQREQDAYLINFLPVETSREHTNTFNPLANMSGAEIVEFFSSLKGEPSGEQAYWFGRGKALLSPITNALYWRKRFLGENFTIPVLYSYVSDFNKYFFLCGLFYLKAKAMEARLKQSSVLEKIFQDAKLKKGIVHEEFPYLDAITYYFNLNPSKRMLLKEEGFDFSMLDLLWTTHQELISYLSQLATAFIDVLQKAVWEYEKRFPLGEVLKAPYEEVIARWDEIRRRNAELFDFGGQSFMDALQQHAYAQQQWTEIFSVLMRYNNIFGSLEPEIDLVDILKNQKFLYVLLPPLKQSPSTTSLLGKLVLTAITKAISTALGEQIEGLSEYQREVLRKRITPIPLGLMVLDEYGAYPIPGIDVLYAQVRSINVSMIVSTQDYTSARVEGKDENSVRRVWANSQKIILRVKDNETIKFLEETMPEVETFQTSYFVDGNRTIEKPEVSVGKEKVFDPKMLQDFKNGLGCIITNADVGMVQFYWADAPEADVIYLNHSRAI